MSVVLRAAALLIAGVLLQPSDASANPLEDAIGRSEVRVRSAPYALPAGRTVPGCGLVERLERLGYHRVSTLR